ncbi:BUD13 homolog [Tiliqua scincoides]|uniref:BUD13 homolog n=1 Tax=Tiliqua scincoides TaxID=71010 RepID=UPI0034633612
MASAAGSGLSKAEYLRRRYLEPGGPEGDVAARKRRRKRKKAAAGGMRIVDDDDTSWKNISAEQEKEDEEGDDGDLPVVAEFIDERPVEVKWMEEFRTSNKWKLLGDQNEESQSSDVSVTAKSTNSSEATKNRKTKYSPDLTPPRRGRHDSPDLCSERLHSGAVKSHSKSSSGSIKEHFSEKRSTHLKREAASHLSPPRKKLPDFDTDLDPLPPGKQPSSLAGPRKQSHSRGTSPALRPLQLPASSSRQCQRHDSESGSDSSPPRRSTKAASDSDLSPPRAPCNTSVNSQNSPDLSPPRRSRHRSSDSDLSPPRRGLNTDKKPRRSGSPPDLSPPRRTRDSKGRGDGHRDPQMLSGGKTGLVSAELLRREQQEFRRQDGSSKDLEAESQDAETVFRDKSGRKRDLKQERLEQRKKVEEKSERDGQYAKWGKGLAQCRQQQQNVEDAVKEMQKPLARYIDDQDLDQMLREQEREGDPMADFIRRKRAKEGKDAKGKPRYNGPAPPLNRFSIWPGYRWDGVDRSNGFEQKRFARIASKKAVQELAYKWSVEDM